MLQVAKNEAAGQVSEPRTNSVGHELGERPKTSGLRPKGTLFLGPTRQLPVS